MNRSYAWYIRQFEYAKNEAEELLEPLSEEEFLTRPGEGRWCVGECISHLISAGNQYYGKVVSGIKEATENTTGSDNPMRLRWHLQWFVNYLEPPIGFKSKSPGSFQPVRHAELNKEAALREFQKLQDDLIAQLEFAQSHNLDLAGLKVSNPIIPLVKMTVAECIAVCEAHQRRHFLQAENALKEIRKHQEEGEG